MLLHTKNDGPYGTSHDASHDLSFLIIEQLMDVSTVVPTSHDFMIYHISIDDQLMQLMHIPGVVSTVVPTSHDLTHDLMSFPYYRTINAYSRSSIHCCTYIT